jgi:2-polyprenyl-6-methoxyphenol hydroxylase-like FAD-dependent oxidoreductase
MTSPFGDGPEVLVVGAGPTGLVMASQLARHGVSVRIVDRNAAPSDVSKAIAVQTRTLEVFDDMGIVQESLDQGLRVHAPNIYSGGRRLAHLGLASVDSSYNFALDLAQDETERILGEYLESFGVRVERQVELTRNGATMDEGLVLDPDLVVHHRFGAPAECLYLIRPDGYVGFRSRPADLDSLQDYLGRIFI